jgi:secreted PhoX family phosphatase
MTLTRRELLSRSGLGAGVLIAGVATDLLPVRAAFAAPPDVFGYGDLVPDPAGLLDLPRGFSYRMLSRSGETFADGTRVPAGHDGMAAFPGRDGETVLVRNHELSPDSATALRTDGGVVPFDARCKGGTSTVVVDDDGALVTHYVSLAGTFRNCAGGPTPWNTWLTCEENDSHPMTSTAVSRPHGYVFEVDPFAPPLGAPVPLTAMGRFAHEAVAVDPGSGTVYETEDAAAPHGCFYRFRPWQPLGGPGSLAAGGVLEVMRVADGPADLSAVTALGTRFADIHWDAIPVPDFDPTSPDATTRTKVRQQTANPTRIPKCEGAYWGDGAVYFVSSFAKASMNPVPLGRHEGQVWRYDPGANTLTLVVWIAPGGTFDGPDNAAASPYGGMFLCEDGDGTNYVVGADEHGGLYPFAHNVLNDSEFAGVTFDRTGRTMFVNVQDPGITYAVTGPWTSRGRGRRP